jgi:hypothetical protein
MRKTGKNILVALLLFAGYILSYDLLAITNPSLNRGLYYVSMLGFCVGLIIVLFIVLTILYKIISKLAKKIFGFEIKSLKDVISKWDNTVVLREIKDSNDKSKNIHSLVKQTLEKQKEHGDMLIDHEIRLQVIERLNKISVERKEK